jgi:hypothetical protein
MASSTSIDLNEVPDWPDLIRDPAEASALYGPFVTDSMERLKLVEEMEHLVEGTVNRMDEGMSAALDYTDESLAALDAIIGDGFAAGEDEEQPLVEVIDDLVMDLGAYLGLMIVDSIGGEWRFRSEIWHASIFFPSIGAECFPFHRVARRLVLGRGDSLTGFYDALIDVLEVGS